MSKDKSHRDKPIQFFTIADVAERLAKGRCLTDSEDGPTCDLQYMNDV
jgi:hypothetical protein